MVSMGKMKTIKIPDETLKFLVWLVRQDVTLPSVMVHYLKWNRYTEKQIKTHLIALYNACTEAEKRV